MKTTRIVMKNILLLLLILPSGCTQSARAVSRAQISPKSATILGLSRRHLQSVRIQIESVFPEPPARRSKIHCFFGNFRFAFPKKAIVILVFFLLPSQRTTGQMQHADHGRSGARFPLSPSRPPASYCPCLPSFCAIVSVLFLTRTSAGLPACCTRLLPHTLCLLP